MSEYLEQMEARFGYLRELTHDELAAIVEECREDIDLYKAMGDSKTKKIPTIEESDVSYAKDLLYYVEKHKLLVKGGNHE